MPVVPQKITASARPPSLNFTGSGRCHGAVTTNFVTNRWVGHNFHFGLDLECWDREGSTGKPGGSILPGTLKSTSKNPGNLLGAAGLGYCLRS